MINEQQTQLAVLAGGKGSRLGADKSRIVIGGMPILEHLMRRLAWRGPTLLIKSRSQGSLAGESLLDRTAQDEHDEQGPLGGIVTAIGVSRASSLLILPIDMTGMTRCAVLFLVSQAQEESICCFERLDEKGSRLVEPFPLLISGECRGAVLKHFASGKRSLRSLFDLAGSRTVPADWPSDVWQNINHQADLKRIGGSVI